MSSDHPLKVELDPAGEAPESEVSDPHLEASQQATTSEYAALESPPLISSPAELAGIDLNVLGRGSDISFDRRSCMLTVPPN